MSQTRIKVLVKRISFLTLLAIGIIPAVEEIKEHLEGKTKLNVQQKPVTKDDMPTVTVCFEHKKILSYPNDFEIRIFGVKRISFKPFFHYNLYNLSPGKNDFIDQWKINRSLVLTEIGFKMPYWNRYCFKISPGQKERQEDDITTNWADGLKLGLREA